MFERSEAHVTRVDGVLERVEARHYSQFAGAEVKILGQDGKWVDLGKVAPMRTEVLYQRTQCSNDLP